MPVSKEEGGRLNAFAKEPEMEVLESELSAGKMIKQLPIFVVLLVIALITIKLSIK